MLAEPPATDARSDRPLVVALTLAIFAFGMQQTLVLPALPALQRDFHASTAWSTWIISLFLLTSCVASPLLGRLGDQIGRRRVLLGALGVFLLGSIVAALAPNLGVLLAARAIQGAGGALIPLSVSTVREHFPRERVGFLIGVLFSTLSGATVLGFTISGVVVDHLSWRYLFVLGAAPITGGFILLWRYLPESESPAREPIDVPGALLLSLGLLTALIGLTQGNAWGWTSAATLVCFAAGAVVLAAWAVVERRVAVPLVDVRMLLRRPVLLTNVCALGLGLTTFSIFTLVPRFTETAPATAGYGFAASATAVGLYMAPGFAIGLVTGPLAGALCRRLGAPIPLAIGCLTMGVGCCCLARWHEHPWQIVAAMLVVGTGWSAAAGSVQNAILEIVPASETGIATGITQVSRLIGGAIGTQIGAAVLASSAGAGSAPTAHAYVIVFLVSAMTGVAAAVAALLIEPVRARLGRVPAV